MKLSMNNKPLPVFIMLLVTANALVKAQSTAGTPVFELQSSHISKGNGTSTGGTFSVTSSIAEALVGTSSNAGFIVHSGLLKPSEAVELIFTNSFE